MTEGEYATLRGYWPEKKPPMIGACPGADRTLLYGYDVDRRTWHLYQTGGRLRRIIYQGDNGPIIDNIDDDRLDARLLVPNKRLYPDACDFGFCRKLRALSIDMTFTTYGGMATRPPGTVFFGRTF